eukprot:6179576-Pleurochrysis_carterae.AAC.2
MNKSADIAVEDVLRWVHIDTLLVPMLYWHCTLELHSKEFASVVLATPHASMFSASAPADKFKSPPVQHCSA